MVSYFSQKRVKGGVYDFCKLCGLEKQLLLSHIVPKWMYYSLKNESPNKSMVGNFPSIGKESVILQDGPKQYLLCSACEQLLGDAENYVKHLLSGRNSNNPELIQRFLLGILFKSHYSNVAPFHSIQVKKSHLHLIQDALLSKSFRKKGFLISAIDYFQVDEINPKAMIYVQQFELADKTYIFSLLAGGREWFFAINNFSFDYSIELLKILSSFKLKENGIFDIPNAPITDYRIFLNE